MLPVVCKFGHTGRERERDLFFCRNPQVGTFKERIFFMWFRYPEFTSLGCLGGMEEGGEIFLIGEGDPLTNTTPCQENPQKMLIVDGSTVSCHGHQLVEKMVPVQ